jgi:hypothetical protein
LDLFSEDAPDAFRARHATALGARVLLKRFRDPLAKREIARFRHEMPHPENT